VTSLAARLVAGTGAGLVLAFAAVGALVHTLARRGLEAELDDELAARARALAMLVEQDGGQVETDLGELAPAPEASVTWFELWLDDGTVLARSPSLAGADLTPTAAALASVRLPGGREGRQATYRFTPRREDEPDGAPRTATIAVARDLAAVDARMARLRSGLVAGGAAAIALCLVLLAWLARFGVAPVRALAARIDAIDEHALAAPLDPAQVPAELAPVVERLGALMRRLDAAFARERELTAEVAHELRTPLAGLRATLELALDREREPAAYRAAMTTCVAICDQIHRLVEALLTLARLDAGTVPVVREPASLAALVAEVRDLFAARIAERRLRLEAVLAPDRIASTDRERLRLVLHNLLDNAVTYADAGGTVRVALADAPGQVAVTVANSGNGVAADEVARVFDRFWRGDPARSGGEHAGLGLALCKKLVEHLGGTIEVEAAGGWFTATVRLPAGSGSAHVS